MKFEPFTLYEARVVSESFQYLKGNELERGKNDIIDLVTISPFDDINKWMFLYFYRDCKDIKESLAHYPGPFYDVLLATELKPEQDTFIYRDLRTYLAGNYVNFDLKSILLKKYTPKE